MQIVSSSRKLILLPEAGAPTVNFPAGAELSEYGANNMTPSIIVLNGSAKTPTWQGVDHETGVVIVNEVPEELAHAALDIIEAGGETNDAIRLGLYFLAIHSCRDQYTTPRAFVANNLSPAGRMLGELTGIVKRDARDQFKVWKEGGVYYVYTDGQREIEPDILVRTYRNPDGSLIDLDQVPEGKPESVAA